MALRIGIDPTGDNPDSPEVVWSAASAPTDFTQFSVTAPAQGSTATVFLRGTLNGRDMSGTAVWDAVTIHRMAQGGVNLDFEAPFITQNSITVPDGWTAWYQDSGYAPTDGRDVYTVYAAWSDSGGYPLEQSRSGYGQPGFERRHHRRNPVRRDAHYLAGHRAALGQLLLHL